MLIEFTNEWIYANRNILTEFIRDVYPSLSKYLNDDYEFGAVSSMVGNNYIWFKHNYKSTIIISEINVGLAITIDDIDTSVQSFKVWKRDYQIRKAISE